MLAWSRLTETSFWTMEQNNYLKLVWTVLFLAFASASCWATAESLRLLLSSWPSFLCWAITIGFFIIASLGTKMIVDSLNQNVYLENRTLKFVGGIVLLLLFWLICSMPTNTHTFFYRTTINDVVNSDISTTCGYLSQIRNNTKNEDLAKRKASELKNSVDILLGELEAEIKNEANPGNGPKAKEILRKIAVELGVAKIEPLSYKGTSKQEREKLCDAYRSMVYILVESRISSIKTNILSPDPGNIREADVADENLKSMRQYIDDGVIDLNNPKDMTGSAGVCDKINEGYNVVKKNKDFVNFNSDSDKEKFTADNPVTEVRRMISVIDVWTDFFQGRYTGRGFIFWIIISILVDVAAFTFFDLAFRKTE